MARPDGSIVRRRVIASAACGRTAVALYLRLPAEADPEPLLSELRRYTAARDWTVAFEAIDRGPLDVPLRSRVPWPELARHLSAGMAQGVVTGSWAMWSSSADETQQTHDWLADHHAFVVVVNKPEPASFQVDVS